LKEGESIESDAGAGRDHKKTAAQRLSTTMDYRYLPLFHALHKRRYPKLRRGSDEERRGLCYDQHHVEAVTGTVTLPEKLPCGLREGFMGKCAFERYLSRKKVR
jgi:hypothetical protein